MTHPLTLVRPLLIHTLAAAVLCSAAIAKPKNAAQPKTQPPAKTASPSPAPAQPASNPKDAAKPAPGRKATPLIVRQNQGDAPPDQSLSHKALIVPREELLARVPATGSLSEEDCILNAIATSPALHQRRADIQLAVAGRQAEKDWRNPELRLSYGSEGDDYLRHPYSETRRTFTQVQPGDPLTPLQRVERTVSPGFNGDTATVSRWDYAPKPGFPGEYEEIFAGTTHERETSSFSSRDGESFSAVLRLQTPHPGVKKARLQRAAADIMLAEAQYLAEEDKLVREVRKLFHDLSVEESTLGAHQKRRQNYAAFRTEMESTNLADFAVDAARASLDMADVMGDSLRTSQEAREIRSRLAVLCSVRDSSRIHSPGITTRRVLDYRALDHTYLTELAMLYRADAVESRGRLGIARARFAEAKAEKVPWATFFDAGWSRQTRDNYSGDEEEWMIRFAFDIPIFDWTRINKRSGEYQKAAQLWEETFNLQHEKISLQVDQAIKDVRRAYADLYAHEAEIKKAQSVLASDIEKAKAGATGLTGFSKNSRLKYDGEETRLQGEISRYRAYSFYNKALRNLEDAIGVRIEKALSGSLSK